MSPRFKEGDRVFFPSRLLPSPDQQPHALTEAKVTATLERSIRVDRQNEDGEDLTVATRLVHGENLGITIFEIGDLETETSTLDPLTKSVLQYLRLLSEDGLLRKFKIRTTSELSRIWATYEVATSHVILIGHGSSDSIHFVDEEDPVTGKQFARLLEKAAKTTKPKTFISLSCQTGRHSFASAFSKSDVCRDYMAPFQSVHSAAASLYAQSFFSHHLLSGEGITASHRKARQAVGDGVSFRRWRDGVMVRQTKKASESGMAD
ncbi:hypothetical protein NY551_14620 [Curtobacterium flaccumfaciens pv. oortii]|uniref:hypothetical protein n=1 Tax=Curtobacterium flaccumfaciens TaxID=2035 RepID=UPI002658212C|nr:hypothetical protein [Curtobacterium flaccumfaciens]MCS5523973.1 hypothetical protein [Curtobacterium flaccumfaciens pv. oortii]